MQTDPEAIARNKALHDINAILTQHGLSSAAIALPTPTGRRTRPLNDLFDAVEEAREGAQRVAMQKRTAVGCISRNYFGYNDVTVTSRCYYLELAMARRSHTYTSFETCVSFSFLSFLLLF